MVTIRGIEVTVERAQVAGAALLAAVFAAFNLPFVHGVLYDVVVGTPSVLQWGVVAGGLAVLAWRRESAALFSLAVGVFVLFGLVVGPAASGVYAHTYVADQVDADAERVDALPNTSKSNVRVLPRSVADTYAQSSMQYPQYRITTADIAYRNGSYRWSYGLVPDNLMVATFGNQKGALYVNMTTDAKDVEVEETRFQNGRGQYVLDSYRLQSIIHAPLEKHDWTTTFNARGPDGDAYIAHSTITYEWHVRLLPFPQIFAVPTHGAVEVTRPDGSVQSFSPSEAANASLLRGQNVYPYQLAMYRVRSMQYQNGFLNKLLWKEDVLAIADLPEAGNDWPIVVPTGTDDAPATTYFVATEPTGSGNGVYEIWMVDGQTGAIAVQSYEDSQIGPRKAVDFVERRPAVNRLSSANAIAPVPVVKDGTLYWHVKVVSQSRSGILYTAFVNAESGDVTLVEGTREVYAFLSREEFQTVTNRTTDDGSGVTVTVVVTDDSGEIVSTQNVTVPEGGRVEIAVEDEDDNATDGNDSASGGNGTATNGTTTPGTESAGFARQTSAGSVRHDRTTPT